VSTHDLANSTPSAHVTSRNNTGLAVSTPCPRDIYVIEDMVLITL
jgi:hypothetical protein